MSIVTEFKVPAMGSEFILRCYPQSQYSKQDCEEIFYLAEKEIHRIENELTEFRPSPFNIINEKAGIEAVEVSQEILDIILYAQKLGEDTNGLFDITSSTLIYPHKLAIKNGDILSDERINHLKSLIDFRKVEIRENEGKIYLPHREMRIGLGGIGKGYAVDRVYELLKSKGLVNFYINGSGDIRVHSHQDAPRPWKVGLQNPFNPVNIVGLIQLSNGALATSGTYKQQGHIYFSGEQELISATVLTETCMECDTLGTILINMDTAKAVSFLDKKNLAGIVINQAGQSYLSKRALSLFGK